MHKSQSSSLFEAICHSPLNTSKSKMLYSFTKQKRFKDDKEHNLDKFYNLPSVHNKRATGFGYGQKYDLIQDNQNTPAPNRYSVYGQIDLDKKLKKGYVFGLSRENLKVNGIFRQNNIPGPGKYNFNSTLSNISYSIRKKTVILDELIDNIPGPGTYEAPGMNKLGVYSVSKMKNSGCPKIDPTPKIHKKSFLTPGPGYYEQNKFSIENDGNYIISKIPNSKSTIFPHCERKIFEASEIGPGPGTYEKLTEFGCKNMDKSMKKQ